MHDTPQTPHLKQSQFLDVYPPSEDTYILLDALELDESRIRSLNPSILLEIGAGSGCVSVFLASMLKDLDCLYLLTDIYSSACTAALKTAKLNNATVEVVNCDLSLPLENRLAGCVDVCVFNPPYVPTNSSDISTQGLKAACNGGVQGRAIIDRMISKIGQLLTWKGIFYIVCIGENCPNDIKSYSLQQGLSCEIFLKRQAGMESLYVLRMVRGHLNKPYGNESD